MSIVFVDTADHYATADVLQKWSISDNNAFSVVASARNSNGLTSSASIDNWLVRNLDANEVTLSMGFVVNNTRQASYFPSQGYYYSVLAAFRDAGTVQVEIARTGSGQIVAFRGPENAALGWSAPGLFLHNVDHYIEWTATINNATGSVEVKLDGEVVLSLSGIDTQETANAFANQAAINSRSNGDAGTRGKVYDDLWIDDAGAYHGDIGGYAILPSGAGASTQWSPSAGSNYQCVDEASVNGDTDYVSETSVGDRDTYAMGNLPAKVNSVVALQALVSARKDDASVREICTTVVSGATTQDGATQTLSSSYKFYFDVYETNPDTAAAWAPSEVDAAECGQKMVA